VIALDPNQGHAYMWRAAAYAEKKDVQSGRSDAAEAVRLSPDNAEQSGTYIVGALSSTVLRPKLVIQHPVKSGPEASHQLLASGLVMLQGAI
jgi:hypothetical protein